MPHVVMARVGSQEITVEDFHAVPRARTRHACRRQRRPTARPNSCVRAIANDLLMQAMKEEGQLADNPTDAAMQKAFAMLMSKHFPAPPAPDDTTLRAYYQKHQADFGIPASVRLSQILIQVPEDASDEVRAATRKRAEDALKRDRVRRVLRGCRQRAFSENPRAKANKGDVGFVWRHGSSWLEPALQGREGRRAYRHCRLTRGLRYPDGHR